MKIRRTLKELHRVDTDSDLSSGLDAWRLLDVTVEIELTDDELWSAYKEKEYQFDLQDIQDSIDCYEEEEIEETFGVAPEILQKLEPQMAYEKRRNEDKYGMNWDFARDEAIKTVIRHYKEGRYQLD